jgi:predicted dehydrogenase
MKKLRLIQCGVGGFGHSWLKDVTGKSADFEVVAIVDVSPENLAKAAADAGIPTERQFATLEAALAAVSADAVLSVTPPPIHVEHARVALAHGLHFMTEKPFADSIEHAREMIRLAGESKRQLLVSQNYRYSPFISRAKQLLAEKTVGNFGHGHIDFYIPADFTGTYREKMEFPLLVDMAIHHLDLIRYVTGRNIVKVTTLSLKPEWSWYAHDSCLKMLLELEDGAAFSYSGDWSGIGRPTRWSGNWRLQCASGSIHIENDEVLIGRCEKWANNPTVENVELPKLEFTERTASLHLFAESIRSGQPCELDGSDNIWSFGAVIAGVESARTGLPVDVRRVVNSLERAK